MKFRLLFIVFCMLTFLPLKTWAFDEERSRNNFSSELVECAVFYDIAAEGSRRNGNLEAATAGEAAAKTAIGIARKYSRDDVVLARYRLAMEDQVNTIEGNYANLSLLIIKYKDICKQAVENPDARLNYWRNK